MTQEAGVGAPRVVRRRRLTTMVLLFLTLAMVPIGVIGIYLNHRLNAELARSSQMSLLARTGRSASGERQVVERSLGAAQSLAEIIDWVQAEPGRCAGYLNRVKESDARIAFIGFIEPDLSVSCSTAGREIDLTTALDAEGQASLTDLMENPRPSIEVNMTGPATGLSVMIINHPRYLGDVFQGYVTISLPLAAVGASADYLGNANPLDLLTFNASGDLLSSERDRAVATGLLPSGTDLAALAGKSSRVFVDTSADGQTLAYAAVPIVPGVIYALGVWPADMLARTTPWTPVANAMMPVAMWLASLLVAWCTIDRLVVARINNLARSMRYFSDQRRLPADLDRSAVSAEMADLETSFRRLAEDVLHEEAEQENRLHEKSVLLKEVHHRVKNNLQIISSIMNMQIRKASAPETKRALSQVQDRIMGLSGVHRTLYQAENLTEVNAASLIERIIEQSRAIGSGHGGPNDGAVRIDTALDPLRIFPDQAVPLSMLVSEALTNAMKYLDRNDPRISVRLTVNPDNLARLQIENPVPTQQPDSDGQSTGLGRQLIRAFATQLNGTLKIHETDGLYRLDLEFKVEAFKDQPLDY